MAILQFPIQPELRQDVPFIEILNARAFGPGRFTRTAYRIRENTTPVTDLSFTAKVEGVLAGSIRFTALRVGDETGILLLGPLAVDPQFAGKGCGRKLIAHGIEAAREQGYRLVLLVGDLSYYGRLGFEVVPSGQISFPGPVDSTRLLGLELEEGALSATAGLVCAI